MNKIILLGRLTRDPEIRTTSSGTTTANFTVAVNRNFKNKDGNYDADFLPCVAFRQTADFISKYFKKGRMISLEGRVQTRNYEAEDGTKRYVTEIVVEGVEFAGDNKKKNLKLQVMKVMITLHRKILICQLTIEQITKKILLLV